MQHRNWLVLSLLCLLAYPVVDAAASPPTVTLARGGLAAAPVVVVRCGALDRFEHTQPTLTDLIRCLNAITDASFERRDIEQLSATSGPGIYLGLAADLQALGVPADLTEQESFLGTTAEGKLLIVGRDPRALSQAVYTFLDHLGCRWYYPGPLWEILPADRDLRVAIDWRGRPDFPGNRRLWIGNGMRTPVIRADFSDWQRRNRMAEPFPVRTHHTWFGLDRPAERKQAFADHPEWFALSQGERKAKKPCYSHPEVIERGMKYAVQYFRDHPDATMVSLSPPDGGDYCTDDLCRKQAGIAGDITMQHNNTPFGYNAQGKLVSLPSQTVFHFVNEVARHLRRECPGKMVGVLAYTTYAHPPTFPLEPNVLVEITTAYRFTPLTMPQQIEAFDPLVEHLGIYGYLDVAQWSFERPGHGAAKLDRLAESFRLYHDHGVAAYSAEMSNNFAPMGVGYYAAARLLWDVHQDVRAIERRFYGEAFGPQAAPHIERVYRRWEAGQGVEDAALAQTLTDLAEAARLTADQPRRIERINHLRMYAHFLALYLKPELTPTRADKSMAQWKQRYGEEGLKQRFESLGQWTRRLTNTHMIHSHPFSNQLIVHAKTVGCDTTDWLKAGEIPTSQEVEKACAEDLKQLSIAVGRKDAQ